MPLPYPPARVDEVPTVCHGVAVADPYRWLNDPASEETRAWLAAQDRLLTAERAGWPDVAQWAERLTALLAAGHESPPTYRGDREFLTRRRAGEEHARLLVREPGTGPAGGADPGQAPAERVLLDPMALDPSGLTVLDSWQPSLEGDLLAYQVSTGGTEESQLSVMTVATGEVIDGPIDRARYSPIAWLPGGQAFYYVRRLDPAELPAGEEQYHRRVWLHRVGSPATADVEVMGAGQPMTSYFGVSVDPSGRWLIVAASDGTAPRTDVWIADLHASPPERPVFTEVMVGLDAQASVGVGRDGRLHVLTDLDAPRGRYAVADPTAPHHSTWQTVIAEQPDAVLSDVATLDDPATGRASLLASWTRHAVARLTLHDPDGTLIAEPTLPGLGAVGGFSERLDGGPRTWFTYTDFVTVGQVMAFDSRTGLVSVHALPPGQVSAPVVRASQVAFDSRDGTTVRMFILAGDERPDRPRPTILTGYGGFGISLVPAFSASILAWVEAGGVYAVANLRGGGEEGEQWHRDGMLGAKQNVFDDVLAAAQALIAAGWTTPGQLSIQGGSNGGLLVGAALTQRPDLFASVVCSAPLLDMVTYEQFGLGATWASEYGTAADPEQFAWLHAYSPYHRVQPGTRYPSVLFTVFAGDTRVDPLHARKMAAALQAATTGGPVLLRCETDVGHGARAVSRSVALAADTLAFTAATTGGEVRPAVTA